MRVLLATLIFAGGLGLTFVFLGAGARYLDGREVGRGTRRKQVAALLRRLDEIEGYARDTLTVNPHDVTAQQILAQAKGARAEVQ